eukprot:TRINITY_DN54563_c0_g1_i1.p1 TRINITY_DN54563_c0_g1~~TRINITY_DN54563_c0_g1_i1.p1  ORF type:complete len:707 (+),score=133.41 TRINITY_DN54563_c0_g1_i1:171-2291(+)
MNSGGRSARSDGKLTTQQKQQHQQRRRHQQHNVSRGDKQSTAVEDELPHGWLRMESRTKKGVFFFAHLASGHTQTEKPTGKETKKHLQNHQCAASIASRRRVMSRTSPHHVTQIDLDAPTVQERRAEREAKRKAAEEARRLAIQQAEVEEASREEAVRKARVERKAWELAAEAAAAQVEEAEVTEARKQKTMSLVEHADTDLEEEEVITKEELETWKENEERREKEDAAAELRRIMEEETRKREAAVAAEAERVRKEEEDRRRRSEETEMARRVAEYEEALASARRKMQEDARRKVREQFLQGALPNVEARPVCTKQYGDVGSMMRPSSIHMNLPSGVPEQVKGATRFNAQDSSVLASQQQQNGVADFSVDPLQPKVPRIPEPSDSVAASCFDVFKCGACVGRHVLSGAKQAWTLGRAPELVDLVLNHESISRKHAVITRRGMFMFLCDLGSAHGTVVDGHSLGKHVPVRLGRGANIRFGASTRVYMYREPGVHFDPLRGTLRQGSGLSIPLQPSLQPPDIDSSPEFPVSVSVGACSSSRVVSLVAPQHAERDESPTGLRRVSSPSTVRVPTSTTSGLKTAEFRGSSHSTCLGDSSSDNSSAEKGRRLKNRKQEGLHSCKKTEKRKEKEKEKEETKKLVNNRKHCDSSNRRPRSSSSSSPSSSSLSTTSRRSGSHQSSSCTTSRRYRSSKRRRAAELAADASVTQR